MTLLAPTLQAFFTTRLISERQASPATIAAYRDTFCLLVRFAAEHHKCQPSALDFAQLDAPLSARSSSTWKTTATTAFAPGTPVSPGSTPCSATPPSTTPNTPAPSNESWPSPTNASNGQSSPSSPKKKPPRSSKLPTVPLGPGDAITPC